MAVYLTLAFIALASALVAGPPARDLTVAGAAASTAGVGQALVGFAQIFAQQFGWGALLGVGGGWLMALLLDKAVPRDVSGGILALLIVAAGLTVFSLTGLVGGSGFLGSTIGWAARRLGLALPSAVDETASRSVFRDFVIDPQAPIGSVCEFYGLPAPVEPDQTVGDWMARSLGRPPVVSDGVRWGDARFAVRSMDGGRIDRVGLGFAGTAPQPPGFDVPLQGDPGDTVTGPPRAQG